MRLLAVPVLALGMIVGSYSDEPRESDMRSAFQLTLATDVQAVLDYVVEVGGSPVLQRVRDAGTDRFSIRAFRKIECTRSVDMAGHVCGFAVDIDVVTGALSHTLNGFFLPGPRGLVFRHEA